MQHCQTLQTDGNLCLKEQCIACLFQMGLLSCELLWMCFTFVPLYTESLFNTSEQLLHNKLIVWKEPSVTSPTSP